MRWWSWFLEVSCLCLLSLSLSVLLLCVVLGACVCCSPVRPIDPTIAKELPMIRLDFLYIISHLGFLKSQNLFLTFGLNSWWQHLGARCRRRSRLFPLTRRPISRILSLSLSLSLWQRKKTLSIPYLCILFLSHCIREVVTQTHWIKRGGGGSEREWETETERQRASTNCAKSKNTTE